VDSTLPTVSAASSTGPAAVAGPVAVFSSAKAQIAAKLLTSEQLLIADQLEIPSNMLRTGAPLSLQANYSRYLVYLEACQRLANLKNTGTWPSGLKVPSQMDLVLLFIGKSAWYDSWCKAFPNITKYPEMVKWLKMEDDRQSDLEVWGIAHNVYNFLHLITWVENGGSLIVEKKLKKGKEKEKGKGKISHKAGSSKSGQK
jgi:hypothetical protein